MRDEMLKSIRSETLKTLGISAGLIVAIAASGAFLVAHAAPGPGVSAAQSGKSFALPPFIDGFAASDQKINSTAAGLKTYTAQAHVYQKCIANFIAAKEGAAQKAGRPLDKTLILIEDHRIAASQADVKKVATEVEIAVDQFNQNGSDCTDGGDITFKNDAPNADGASDADNDLDVPG
jgi:hypothetical protein